MAINWLTVFAQIFNFLLLVYLLKRFLYRPVIDAMERREQRIAQRLDDAVQREHAASDSEQHYVQQSASLEAQRKELITLAQAEATEEKAQMLAAARDEIDTLRQQWQQDVQQEKERFMQEFTQFSTTAVGKIASHALAELAEQNLEQQMVRVFLQRCEQHELELHSLLAQTSGVLRVRSSQPLAAEPRDEILRALRERWQFNDDVLFDTDPALTCGIELLLDGRTIGWSVAEYAETTQQRVQTALENLSIPIH